MGKAADFTAGSPATIPFTKQYDFTSKINGLGYRVWISSPAEVDPTRAYPIIYGLDGNSIAGMAFWRQDGRLEPVVQVFIGYPTEEPVEPRRRFLDLTFSERNPDKPGPPPPLGAKGGGGDTFARVIEEEIKPFVRSRFKTDPARQAIWGHSLGGLELMRILYRNPKAFSIYCISSPSIWWNDREILKDEDAFARRARDGEFHLRILVLSAGNEQPPGQPGRLVDDATELADRLRAIGPALNVTRTILPDESHGSVIPASFNRSKGFVLQKQQQ
jgi:predicted alpha/beta superfamily hydrolase